jgi:hypothetical protein
MVASSFLSVRTSSGDDSYDLIALGVNNHDNSRFFHQPDCDKSYLAIRKSLIYPRPNRPTEDGLSLFEADPVLFNVGLGFFVIPFKLRQ